MKNRIKNQMLLGLIVIALALCGGSICSAQSNTDSLKQQIMIMQKQVTAIDLKLRQSRTSLKQASNRAFMGFGITIGGTAMIGGATLYASSPKALGNANGLIMLGGVTSLVGLCVAISAWGKIREAGIGPLSETTY